MAAGQGAQEHGTGREIYSTCELLVRLAAAAFDRVAEKYAFQGGHRSPSHSLLDGRSKEAPLRPLRKWRYLRRGLSPFPPSSPFLRPETNSPTFCSAEQSSESKSRLNLKNFHETRRGLRGISYSGIRLMKYAKLGRQRRWLLSFLGGEKHRR